MLFCRQHLRFALLSRRGRHLTTNSCYLDMVIIFLFIMNQKAFYMLNHALFNAPLKPFLSSEYSKFVFNKCLMS